MSKMTRSEAGKLGAIKSTAMAKAARESRIFEYLKNPKICQQIECDEIILYDKRKNKFCSHSCAAKTTNGLRYRETIRPQVKCLKCNKLTFNQKYCSRKCRNDFVWEKILDKFNSGILSDRGSIRRVIIQIYGEKCQSCQLTHWLNSLLPLEINYIDGNAGNNDPNNLELICPNCHSITPNWKGRNAGFGRKSRGLPLS